MNRKAGATGTTAPRPFFPDGAAGLMALAAQARYQRISCTKSTKARSGAGR